jgi:RecA-family ATPase
MSDMSEYLSIEHCISTPPRPLDFVIPGLVAGTVGSIVAPGATGKSWLALQIAAAVAGADTLDINPPTGRVLYLASEDPHDVLHARVHALAGWLNEAQRDALIERLHIWPTLGQTGDLLDDGRATADIARRGEGCRLIVIDTLSRWHTGDENARADAARVMRRLEQIAAATGAAVLYLHHTSKAAALDGNGSTQQAARGSSVWVDEARFCLTMAKCSESEARDYGIDDEFRDFFVKLTVAKANYIPPQPARWLRRRDGGVFEPVEMFNVPRRGGKGGDDGKDW